MEFDIEAPDDLIQSRRSVTVGGPSLDRMPPGPVHLVVDSTGLKMLGDGEWYAHKNRTASKRRSWWQLYLGVGAQGFIVASELTSSGAEDGRVGVVMSKEIRGIEVAIERFTDDGAYDSRAIYAALTAGRWCVIRPA